MKIKSDKIELEKGEPAFRSCWSCNPAHEHLKQVNWLHVCLMGCGRYWIFDRFLDEFEDNDKIVEWLKSLGLKDGESTTKIDKGYRITHIKFQRK